MPKPRRTDLSDRVAVVIVRVLADLGREWTIADMADVLGISGTHLRRMVAGQLGTSPKRLLTDLRLQSAAELLDDPSIRLKEILVRVGATDASHFCRAFRQRFGVSPSEYRGLRVEQRAILPIKKQIGFLTLRREKPHDLPTT